MPRALNKITKEGVGYTRPSHIEMSIDHALGQGLDEHLRRVKIRDPADSDYMPSECLVHIVREARLCGNDGAVNKLLPYLFARGERRLKRTIPDSWPDAQGKQSSTMILN